MMKTLEELLPLYIRLRQHQTSDEGSRTTLGCTGSPRPQHDVLAPWIINMASLILHAAMWGKQDIDVEY
jgi:hypothetical protein